MSELIVSTQVAAPLEKTFEAFTQLDKAADRVPAITSLEVLTEGPFGEGTRWRETRMMFKKEATEVMWVTGFNPPHSYTVEAESHGSRYSTLFEFKPEGDGTKVRWSFTATPLTFGAKIMAPIFGVLMKGTMKKCMLGDLEAIGNACEQDDA
ncbi:MAG: SRPBCC family protein [Planctomycetota bacterium]|nr:SRPBCC family protein [Planctomycetota bacterium]